MWLFNKLVGSSKFQEEFTKYIGFNWTLVIDNFSGFEYTRNYTTIKKSDTKSTLFFDFNLNELFIDGDLVDEVFGGNKHFVIVRKQIINYENVFHFSILENKSIIVMKCTVMRNQLLFEGLLTNWTCKVP